MPYLRNAEVNLNITYEFSRMLCFWLAFLQSSLILTNWSGGNLQECTEAMRLGIAILNSEAMHTLVFWVRIISDPSGAAILNSGVGWALNLSPAWKNELMRMVSIFWKNSKSGATAVRAHSLTFYAPARLNRYPRITDAGGCTMI